MPSKALPKARLNIALSHETRAWRLLLPRALARTAIVRRCQSLAGLWSYLGSERGICLVAQGIGAGLKVVAQTALIQRHSAAPISHNFMGLITDLDHFAVGADPDIATWDAYPLGVLSKRLTTDADHTRRFVRQGDPDFQAFHRNLYRQVRRGRLWILEQQPGPVTGRLGTSIRCPVWPVYRHGRLLPKVLRQSAISGGVRPLSLKNRCMQAFCAPTAFQLWPLMRRLKLHANWRRCQIWA